MNPRPLLVAASIAALSIAGCGGEEEAAGGGGGSQAGGGGSQAGGGGQSAKKADLALGDGATLKGLEEDTLKVAVLSIDDPMKNPATERPKQGRRFVGVRVRIENVGKKPYDDSVQNGTRLVTNMKEGANPTVLLSGKCPSKWGIRFKLAPGATKTGCLPYQVLKKAKVTGVEMRLNSGYGPETATWKR